VMDWEIVLRLAAEEASGRHGVVMGMGHGRLLSGGPLSQSRPVQTGRSRSLPLRRDTGHISFVVTEYSRGT
jgi:hypothetical protein